MIKNNSSRKKMMDIMFEETKIDSVYSFVTKNEIKNIGYKLNINELDLYKFVWKVSGQFHGPESVYAPSLRQVDLSSNNHSFLLEANDKLRYAIFEYILENSDDGLDNDNITKEDIDRLTYKIMLEINGSRDFYHCVERRLEILYAYFGLKYDQVYLGLEKIYNELIDQERLYHSKQVIDILRKFKETVRADILNKIDLKSKKDEHFNQTEIKQEDINLRKEKELDEKIEYLKIRLEKLKVLSEREKELEDNLANIRNERQQIISEISGLKK